MLAQQAHTTKYVLFIATRLTRWISDQPWIPYLMKSVIAFSAVVDPVWIPQFTTGTWQYYRGLHIVCVPAKACRQSDRTSAKKWACRQTGWPLPSALYLDNVIVQGAVKGNLDHSATIVWVRWGNGRQSVVELSADQECGGQGSQSHPFGSWQLAPAWWMVWQATSPWWRHPWQQPSILCCLSNHGEPGFIMQETAVGWTSTLARCFEEWCFMFHGGRAAEIVTTVIKYPTLNTIRIP